MFKLRKYLLSGNPTVAQWYLLLFLAGSINATGFLASAQFVTHVTGVTTLLGVSIGNGNWSKAIEAFTIPMFFLFGTSISGFLLNQSPLDSKQTRYSQAIGLVSVCLFLVTFCNYFDVLEPYSSVFLLALASGLQNGAVTLASASAVRATHITGLITDLGLNLPKVLFPKGASTEEKRSFYFRASLLLSFVFGSIFGSTLFLSIDQLSFIASGLIALYIAVSIRMTPKFV
jgi:uncharacterized membrane protein YoaK (UPF0700 family)